MAGGSSERGEGRLALALRVASQEYLPLGGWLLIWAAVAAAYRPADAVRLLAATLMCRAVRELVAMDTGAAMRRRYSAAAEAVRKSMRVAMRVEAATLVVSIAALTVIVALLVFLDQPRAAWLTAILGISLPARHFAAANRGHRHGGLFAVGAAWSGLALILAVIVLDLGIEAAAWAMALREYAALALTLILKPNRPPRTPQTAEPLRWREVAAITATLARHRLAYRVSKGLLSIFGPLGSIAARTGRGVGAHRKLDRFTPQAPWKIAALAGVTAGVAGVALYVVREPATLVVAAGLLRVAAAATSTAVWAHYGDAHGLSDIGAVDDED